MLTVNTIQHSIRLEATTHHPLSYTAATLNVKLSSPCVDKLDYGPHSGGNGSYMWLRNPALVVMGWQLEIILTVIY